MAHFWNQRDHGVSWHQAVTVGQLVHREMLILRPRKPKCWHFGSIEAKQRIPNLPIEFVLSKSPPVLVVGLRQITATVYRDREGEARVDSHHRAGDHSSPRNPHDANLCFIHFRQGADERVCQNRIGHRVIHPLVLERLRGIAVDTGPHGSGPWMSLPCLSLLPIGLSFHRDADRCVTFLIPLLDPQFERAAPTTVHQHDAGHLALAIFGKPEPGKDLGRLAFPIEAIEIDGFEVIGRFEALGVYKSRRGGEIREGFHARAQGGEIFSNNGDH